MDQIVRIIAGIYRGKKLHFPASPGLRPTPSRVRETLFNWLMQSVRGARCLDAYAGSGALGFEAFSRGASHVTLIDNSPAVCHYLKQQVRAFNNPALQIIQADTMTFLTQHLDCFDIIFFDPPFALFSHLPPALFDTLAQRLMPGGLLYLESPQASMLEPQTWISLKSKRAGQVNYALYQKKPA